MRSLPKRKAATWRDTSKHTAYGSWWQTQILSSVELIARPEWRRQCLEYLPPAVQMYKRPSTSVKQASFCYPYNNWLLKQDTQDFPYDRRDDHVVTDLLTIRVLDQAASVDDRPTSLSELHSHYSKTNWRDRLRDWIWHAVSELKENRQIVEPDQMYLA